MSQMTDEMYAAYSSRDGWLREIALLHSGVQSVRRLCEQALAQAVTHDEDGPSLLHEPVVRVDDVLRLLRGLAGDDA
jgi:hypothetical protein